MSRLMIEMQKKYKNVTVKEFWEQENCHSHGQAVHSFCYIIEKVVDKNPVNACTKVKGFLGKRQRDVDIADMYFQERQTYDQYIL